MNSAPIHIDQRTFQISQNLGYRFVFLVFHSLNTLLIARIAGPEYFGLFSLLITNVAFLLLLLSGGIPSTLLFHAAKTDRSPDQLAKILWFTNGIQVIALLVIEAFHQCWTGRYWLWPEQGWNYVVIGFLFFLSAAITEKYGSLYQGYGYFSAYLKIQAVIAALTFTFLLLILLIPERWAIQWVLCGYVLIQFIQSLSLPILFQFLPKQTRKHESKQPDSIQGGYAVTAYFANLIQFLAFRADLWLIVYFINSETTGIYALASRFIQLFTILPAMISGSIFTSLAGGIESKWLAYRYFRIVNTLNLVLMIPTALVTVGLLPIVFGDGYQESIPVFLIALPGVFLLAGQTIICSYFAAQDLIRINLYGSICTFSIGILMNVILIPIWGITGAAIAGTLAHFSAWIFILREFVKKNESTWPKLFLQSDDLNWLRSVLILRKSGNAN